jgi:hypothetical protein
MAIETGHGVPVQEGCKAPHDELRPVRQGKKSGPAGGVQGRSVRGRVGLPAGWAGKGGLGCGLLTTRPGRYGKERRAGRQEGCKAGWYGGGLANKSGRAGTGGLERSRPASETSYPGQYNKESRTAGPVQDDCRADRYRRDSCTMHNAHTSQPADHINRQLVKQQRR